MNYKYLIYIFLAAAIIIAIILKDKIKASFLGLKLNAENLSRSNKSKISGGKNKLQQSSDGKIPVKNNTKIKGDGNNVRQS